MGGRADGLRVVVGWVIRQLVFVRCGVSEGDGFEPAERSSGMAGRLKISKRGSSSVRRWLYLAALRWLKTEPGAELVFCVRRRQVSG